jgi:hypothetical protein
MCTNPATFRLVSSRLGHKHLPLEVELRGEAVADIGNVDSLAVSDMHRLFAATS